MIQSSSPDWIIRISLSVLCVSAVNLDLLKVHIRCEWLRFQNLILKQGYRDETEGNKDGREEREGSGSPKCSESLDGERGGDERDGGGRGLGLTQPAVNQAVKGGARIIERRHL
jgi:hypothetical protein